MIDLVEHDLMDGVCLTIFCLLPPNHVPVMKPGHVPIKTSLHLIFHYSVYPPSTNLTGYARE